jgi:hypothetical protein
MRRPWRESVLDAVHRLSRGSPQALITRQQVIAEELPTIVRETQSPSQTPGQSLSYWLQQLRKEGILEFVDRHGLYRLVRPVIDVEEFDGTEQEMDAAIQEGRLRFGRVETSTAIAMQRRRCGQARLRELCLVNYSRTCALCDLQEKNLLVTSHIVPWSVSIDGRGDLANVIILCKAHDSLFEAGYWSLSDELQVLRAKKAVKSWSTMVLLPDGVTFREPIRHRPGLIYVTHHRERHGFSA